MSDRYLQPNYNPTEGERLHQRAMKLGSAALLARLKSDHPAIVARLLARAQERNNENV